MSDNGGWIKLWRRSLESEVFADPHLWRLWCWCLMSASHEEQWVSLPTGRGSQRVRLSAGQLVFGRNAVAARLGENPSSLARRLQRLADMGNLSITVGSHFSVVTVNNWQTYQDAAGKSGHPMGRQWAGNGQANSAKSGQANSGEKSRDLLSGLDDPDGDMGRQWAGNGQANSTKSGHIQETRNKKKNARAQFVPPSLEEVAAYCRERQNSVDAQRWFDHYIANGWRVGKNPMKDWRAAVRTWERNGFHEGNGSGHADPAPAPIRYVG